MLSPVLTPEHAPSIATHIAEIDPWLLYYLRESIIWQFPHFDIPPETAIHGRPASCRPQGYKGFRMIWTYQLVRFTNQDTFIRVILSFQNEVPG